MKVTKNREFPAPATKATMMADRKKETLIWLVLFFGVFLWSALNPRDYFTWFLEVFPALLGLLVLTITFNSFPLSSLTCWLILIHAIILMVGGHYTYAQVPLFNWLRDAFDLSRNHYDRVGHFAQGFVPALIAREILLRTSPLRPGKWLSFLVVCVCLAISVSYEFIEWWVALLTGSAADAFLGTQGDAWDTQWDMFLAMMGAISALATLSTWQDRSLRTLEVRCKRP